MGAPSARRRTPQALKLLRTQTTVELSVVTEALGFAKNSDAIYDMATRYRERIAKERASGHPISLETLRPRRGKNGEWIEIPNDKYSGAIRCRSDLVLWMLFPESQEEEE